MDDRLDRVAGHRLVHLLRSDAPRVAQAMIDKMRGHAQVYCRNDPGKASYLEFVYPGVYSVVIRADDWRKIFPLVRYGSGFFTPVIPPEARPAPVPSPQANRVMQPAPVNPGVGFTSFLEHFTWEEYKLIQRLLTISNVGREEPGLSFKVATQRDPISLDPGMRRAEQSGMPDIYERLVGMLQQLFPNDYPTSKV